MYNDNTDMYDIYRVWAPDEAEWTAWAKPVLFTGMYFTKAKEPELPETVVTLERETMVIVDLPGKQSVEVTLAIAKKGYRPVPLYNGTFGPGNMLVNVYDLGEAVYSGTAILKSLSLPPDAPPVFMLDSDRMTGTRKPDAYDNRWCVFPQDMPSAQYLKNKGIYKIIVRSINYLKSDLVRILYEYQKGGIELFHLRTGAKAPVEITVGKQSLTNLAYRFKTVLGLKRNSTGGFGGSIPEPYDNGSYGGRYYGMG